MEKCRKCKTQIVGEPHKCSSCEYVLCRRCDDTSNLLRWWGTEPLDSDGSDLYLCEKCLAKHTGMLGSNKKVKKKKSAVEDSGVLSAE